MSIIVKDMSKIIIPQFLLRLLKGRYSPRDTFRGLHSHPEWQWDFLHAGAMTVRLSTGAERLRAGEAILLPPDVSHGFTWLTDCTYSSFKFLWPGAPDCAARSPRHLRAEDLDPTLLQGLLASATRMDAAGESESACWLHLLLLPVFRAEGAAAPSLATESLVARVEALVVAGGYQPLSLARMAQRCHLSVAQFLRRFQQASGSTPAQYVLRLRLQRAAALLRYGDMNISQVAQVLGWPDVFSFSKAWKRHRGQSPREWLRQLLPASHGAPPAR